MGPYEGAYCFCTLMWGCFHDADHKNKLNRICWLFDNFDFS